MPERSHDGRRVDLANVIAWTGVWASMVAVTAIVWTSVTAIIHAVL